MDVLLSAHFLEYFRPYGGTNLSNMRFVKQKHKCAGLPDAAADAEWNLVIHNCTVVWQFEEVKLICNLQLFLERFGVYTDTHRR